MAIQRRFLLAITIPLAILAVPAILAFSEWLHQRVHLSKATGWLFVGLLICMGTLFRVTAYGTTVMNRSASLFEPVALVEATDWLGEHGTPEQIVLASQQTAHLIGMRTPLKLYFGHEMETLHFIQKAQMVEGFYRREQSATWLEDQGISWIIFGPHEKRWGESPPDMTNLEVAYQNDAVTIYEVVTP
jgi:hypothetical protein